MRTKQKNNYLGVFLILYTLLSVYGFDYLIDHMQTITGKGSAAAVQLTVLPSSISPIPEPQPQGGSSLRGGLAFFVLRTAENERITTLTLETLPQTSASKEIIVKNYGDTPLVIAASASLSAISLSPSSLTLVPGEESSFHIEVIPSPIGVYTGYITFAHDIVVKKTPIIIHVRSAPSSPMLSLVIPSHFATVPEAGQLFAQISFSSIMKEEISFDYIIQDMSNQIFFQESEMVTLSTTAFDKTIQLPSFLHPGDYALIVTASLEGRKYSAPAHFTIRQGIQQHSEIPQPSQKKKNVLILMLILFLLTLVSFFLFRKKR